MTESGPNPYNEKYFQAFEVISNATKFWRSRAYGTTSTGSLVNVAVDDAGSIRSTYPVPGTGDNYTLSCYYMSGYLATITKNGLTKYFPRDGNNNITGVTEWL